MRIIHILHSHGYGGAENHALLLMQGMRQAGHDVLFAGPLDSWLGQACKAQGIEAEHVSMHGLYDIVSHLRLRRLVRRWRPDIVHGHMIRGAHYAGLTDGGARPPMALGTAHDTAAYKHMQRCRHIITVSAAVQSNLVDRGYDQARTTVIYNGVADTPSIDTVERDALRQELGIARGTFAVINTARFIHYKGQDQLVAALPMCTSRIHLYLAGDPDTKFGRAVQRAAHGSSRVHFLGYRPDVPRILPAFDAFVLASRHEAISLAVIEAFAASVPVVATKVGGVPEIVVDQTTGLIAEPDDAASLARGIMRLERDAVLAQRLAAMGRRLFVEQLTASRMVDSTLALYARCLRRNGAT